jgi:tetratricopeptide (TPR) repeat protein
MAKKSGKGSDSFVAVESALSKTEQIIEKNQKVILIVVSIIVVIVLGFFAYKKLYIAPLNKDAQEQMFMAEMYFQQNDFEKALYGDGTYLGFLDIIDEYGSTKSGNLANYYTGLIYLKQGKYDEALDFLKSFESDDKIVGPLALGAIGDAYIEKGQPENAIDYYL